MCFDASTHVHRIGRDYRDLKELLFWMERDWEEFGEGFWCHREMLSEGIEAGDLYVATCQGTIMGFQLGETSADLLQVYSRYRRQGVGSALIWALVSRAAKVGKRECTASTSDVHFWERIGFVKTPRSSVGVPGGTLMVCEPEQWLMNHSG